MNQKYAGKLSAALLALLLLPPVAGSADTTGITTAALRLRKGASTSSAVLTTIPRGTAIEILGSQGDFYQVKYGSRTGYASMDYITAASLPDSDIPASTGRYSAITASSAAEEIRSLQYALQELGYYFSSVDGKYGNGTKKAVNSFQSKNGLSQSGYADAATLSLLFDGTPKNSKGKSVKVTSLPPLSGLTLSRGVRGEPVRQLQERLKELGYYKSGIDASFGSTTENAVKAFQKKMGLNQTGIADMTLQSILYSSSALSASATTPPSQTGSDEEAVYPFVTYTLTSVNLRKGKSTSTTRYTTIPSGASVTVLKTDGDYLQVTYKSYTGYVPAQYVDVPAKYLSGKVLSQNMQARLDYVTVSADTDSRIVTALQSALKELGFYTKTADGVFGSGTVSAVKDFQKKNGLRPDGDVTPEVQQFLFESKVKNSSGRSVYVNTLPPVDNWPMEENDTGYQVKELQTKLATLGLYSGSITGTYDKATVKAVKAFQTEYGLTCDGKAGTKTLTRLNSLTSPDSPLMTATPAVTPLTPQNVTVLRSGSRGDTVKQLQQALVELGYYSCVPDGIYNSDDIAAVKAFQKQNGLSADGIAGYDTQTVLFSGSAIPAPTPKAATPTPTPKTTARLTATPAVTLLRRGSTGSAVREMQTRLKELNYYSGLVDGDFGAGTENAVKAFQKQNGLTADGEAGTKTLTKLYSSGVKAAATARPTATPTPAPTLLKLGSTGDEVKKLQQRLIELGYLESGADGSFGYKTYSAVVAFQKQNKLASDGIAGPSTLNKLYSSSAVKAPAGTTVPMISPTPKPDFTAPKASQVIYANWYTEIRARAKMMPDVVIYDPDTGLHYNLHMFSFGKHADAEPPTAKDTAIMNQVIGTNSWTPHAVWVIFQDGRVYLASTHSHGHEVDHTSGNDLEGHVCIHFPREMSEAEETGPYAVSHQNEIRLGLTYIESLCK